MYLFCKSLNSIVFFKKNYHHVILSPFFFYFVKNPKKKPLSLPAENNAYLSILQGNDAPFPTWKNMERTEGGVFFPERGFLITR
jgi:hypothetical protein